jgi:membrane-bound lytic murein transglycosylase MltF
MVDFAKPWLTGVKELVVTGPGSPAITTIDQLGGRELMVRPSSSYHSHLVALNARLGKEQKAPVKIVAADESLEDEDLLQMVSAGLLPWAIVDSHKAKLWAGILKGLTVREDLAIHEGGQIAWAIRENSPRLKKELDEFVGAHGVSTAFGADVRLRYLTDGRVVRNALAQPEARKFQELVAHFATYGGRFAVDPFLLAAQGYQESRLNQTLRMKSGAVGVMQIKPSTAREKDIGIDDVETRAEDNIHAGAKYVRYLADRYVNDPAVSERDRVLMALAAYNAGPGNLKKFRENARKNGLDPNVWFGNVEHGAAAIIGQETVQYIGNIYKYYVAYSVLLRQREAEASAAPAAPPATPAK